MVLLLALAACQSGDISTEALKRDLAVVQEQLPKLHYQFDRIVPPAEWKRRCDETRADLERLTGTARQLRMMRLVASIGVAHTYLDVGNQPFHVLPIRFRSMSDGLFVYAADEPHDDLLGAQVLSIGGKGEREIIARIGGMEPSENEYWRRVKVSNWCGAGDVYAATGLSKSPDAIPFKFKLASGQVVDRVVAATTDAPKSYKRAFTDGNTPAFMKATTYNYRVLTDEASKSVVLDYRRCAADNDLSMEDATKSFWQQFDGGGYEKAVIDLRRNGGGNSAVLWPFLSSLKDRSDLVKKGRVFAFVSGETFSSGMLNAVQLRKLGVILVGEPTGGSPNSYGEQKSFVLPESGMNVMYCTKFFAEDRSSNATSVVPDVRISWTWKDSVQGRDACMEWLRTR